MVGVRYVHIRWAICICFVILSSSDAAAQLYCDSLSTRTVGVAEGRVKINSSNTISRYANAYHDSGAELSLTSSYPIGWLNTGQYYYAGASTYIEDETTSSCIDAIITLFFWTKSGGCSPGTYRGYTEFKINTCNIAGGSACDTDSDGFTEECLFWSGRFIKKMLYESNGDIFYKLEVDDGTNKSSDTGCFNIGSSASACY